MADTAVTLPDDIRHAVFGQNVDAAISAGKIFDDTRLDASQRSQNRLPDLALRADGLGSQSTIALPSLGSNDRRHSWRIARGALDVRAARSGLPQSYSCLRSGRPYT